MSHYGNAHKVVKPIHFGSYSPSANFSPTELKAIDKILSLDSVILKVINSSRKITPKNIERFEKKCKKAYIYQLKKFPFWPMNDSKHRLWTHSARKMRLLGGYSCGLISENALERSHKVLRRLAKNHTRKGRIDLISWDTLNHMWNFTSPKQRNHRPKKPKKPLKLETADDFEAS